MADKVQVWNDAGVLTQQWDDSTSTYTQYDPTTGALTLTRAYTAAETAQAQTRATVGAALGNLTGLQTKAQNAQNNNAAYLALASPTNAQVVAQVAALTRQCNALIKLEVQDLTSTTGT